MLPPGASMAVITVISGTFNMGFGDELDMGQGKTLPAGSILRCRRGFTISAGPPKRRSSRSTESALSAFTT
jgi:hypothetical protein